MVKNFGALISHPPKTTAMSTLKMLPDGTLDSHSMVWKLNGVQNKTADVTKLHICVLSGN